MEVIIEDLKYEDIAECYELCKECFNEEYGLEEVQDLYKEISKQSNYRFLVAKVNNKIVGYTSAIMAYNLFDGKRPFMTLWWVCTHPSYRRQGVATKLFNRIEEIAIENNCELIYFTSEVERTGAHKFYESMGYKSNSDKAFIKMLD
ncbi:MAG: GNAT family N-acetyltransferase [Clostridia bacterium]|nr:GNAT family N-acetyltransferase [Clostridia bacterium]